MYWQNDAHIFCLSISVSLPVSFLLSLCRSVMFAWVIHPLPLYSGVVSMHFRGCFICHSVPLAASISQLVFPLRIYYLFLSLPHPSFPFHSNQFEHNGLVCFLREIVIGPNTYILTLRHTNLKKQNKDKLFIF